MYVNGVWVYASVRMVLGGVHAASGCYSWVAVGVVLG